MEKSMRDQLKKSREMTCEGSLNATSSAGSSVGPSPCNSPDGETHQCGLLVSRANRSALQERAEGQMMLDISGPTCGGSSKSADLQRCLASRLLQRLDVNGSPEYSLTWREWGMPSREPICALRASEHRTCGKGCGGWPTPRTITGGAESAQRKQELGRAQSGGGDLQAEAMKAGWPTPNTAPEAPNMSAHRGNGKMSARNTVQGLGDAAKTAGWATPRASSSTESYDAQKARGNKHGANLDGQANLTGATPGSPAAMEPRGVLNPAFPLWLMGFPEAWATCAPGAENWAMIQRALCEMLDASEREHCEGQGTQSSRR